MANGSGGPIVPDLFKMAFGDVPTQWIRLVAFGVFIAWGVFALRDFGRETREQNDALRKSLSEYIASNKAWQEKSTDERRYLIGKVNARFDRLYKRNGWEHEAMEVPR